MKRGILVVMLIASLAFGVGTTMPHAESFWGDEFIIGLDANPSTGYSWEAKFNAKEVELVRHWYVQGEAPFPNYVGISGVTYFRFKLLTSRITAITMTYKRPWEKQYIDQKIFWVCGQGSPGKGKRGPLWQNK